jgi:hypothetical protein
VDEQQPVQSLFEASIGDYRLLQPVPFNKYAPENYNFA